MPQTPVGWGSLIRRLGLHPEEALARPCPGWLCVNAGLIFPESPVETSPLSKPPCHLDCFKAAPLPGAFLCARRPRPGGRSV